MSGSESTVKDGFTKSSERLMGPCIEQAFRKFSGQAVACICIAFQFADVNDLGTWKTIPSTEM